MCYRITRACLLCCSFSGSSNGLRLLLNIEQYEYMVGPNEAAGIKMLLHDPNEAPLVEELGMAVAPGSHAFAAILMLEVSVPPQPAARGQPELPPTSGYQWCPPTVTSPNER